MENIDSDGDCSNIKTCYTTTGRAVNTTNEFCGLDLVVKSDIPIKKDKVLESSSSVENDTKSLDLVAAIKQS